MTTHLTEAFDRVAATAVLAAMVAAVPLAGVMFVVKSLVV
jgi:hypothetical protein